MKIAVLGQNGMLGGALKRVAEKEKFVRVYGFGRESLEIYPRKLNDIGAKLSNLLGFDTDYVVNCIGAIKPTFRDAKDLTAPIYTNAVFPHQLSLWGELTDTKVIHVTTDCVFSGLKGGYNESDPHDALDEYGKTKSLGEPQGAMVLRTSIIGPEFGGRKRSFFEWIRSQAGKTVNGFMNHIWNGLTTIEFSQCILDIIDSDVWKPGVFHVYGEQLSKCDMIELISKQFDFNITIEPKLTMPVDRSLSTIKELNDFLQPSSFDEMIYDMWKFCELHKG